MSNGVPLVPAPRVPPQTPPPRAPPRGGITIQIGIPISVQNPLIAIAAAARTIARHAPSTQIPGISGELPPFFQPPQPLPVPTVPPVTRIPVRLPLPMPFPQSGIFFPIFLGDLLIQATSNILDRMLQRESDRMIEEAEEEIERLRRLRRAQILVLPPMPQFEPQPGDLDEIDVRATPSDVGIRPRIVIQPDFVELPDPVLEPLRPAVRPGPIILPTLPTVTPETRPVGTPAPAPPRPAIRLRPLFLPFGQPFAIPGPTTAPLPHDVPVPLPLPLPIPTPFAPPSLRPLTPFQPSPLQFAQPAAAPESLADPQTAEDRCQRSCEKRKRRNRATCWKGLYRESTSRTKFNKWQRIDCRTGREL